MEIMGQTSKESDVRHEKGGMIAVYFLTLFLASRCCCRKLIEKEWDFLCLHDIRQLQLWSKCSSCIVRRMFYRKKTVLFCTFLLLYLFSAVFSALRQKLQGFFPLYSTCAFSFPLFFFLPMTRSNWLRRTNSFLQQKEYRKDENLRKQKDCLLLGSNPVQSLSSKQS